MQLYVILMIILLRSENKMDNEIICYLLSRGVSVTDIQKLSKYISEIQPKENSIFDIDFQKYIIFNSTFLDSNKLYDLVCEMNRGDCVMVDRILGDGLEKTFTPEKIVKELGFEDVNSRENNINTFYIKALQLTVQKELYRQFKIRLQKSEKELKRG